MKDRRFIQYTEYIFTTLFCAGVFIFFAFLYNHHLHFKEQIQLFLLTDDYLFSKLAKPGGLSGYIGEFLTQFYYLSLVGPIILVLLLFSVQQVTKKVLYNISSNRLFFPLSFLPAVYAAMIMCDEFYPLSAIIGYLIALLSGLLYTGIKTGRSRFISGLVLIPLTYWLAGGTYLMLLFMMLVFELITFLRSRKELHREITGDSNIKSAYNIKIRYFIAYLILAAGIPLLVKQYFILQPMMLTFMSEFYYNIRTTIPAPIPVLFALPVVLMILVHIISIREKYLKAALVVEMAGLVIVCLAGLRVWANYDAEVIMKYDYLVRNARWNEVIKFAGQKPPRNYLSLAMLNLSLAKTGQMGNRMFNYDQHGINGLFLPFNREYVAPMMGNEIFYHMGLTNASQEYAFESMETIPNYNKSIRLIKRLAETNLINGNYEVSGKYLKLLRKTIFYREWAMKTEKLLYNEEMINNHPDYGEKRNFMVRNDYFFHVQNMEAVLNRMVKENPGNQMAFEYLMAFYMINKDLGNFMNCIPLLEKMNYREVPVSYQEAMMYIIGLSSRDAVSNAPSYINPVIINRMKTYAEIYTNYPDAGERLAKSYSDTYWYYLHFADIDDSTLER